MTAAQTPRERAIQRAMLELDEEPHRLGIEIRYTFDDGHYVATYAEVRGIALIDRDVLESARREVAEIVVDRRARLREMTARNWSMIQQLERELAAAKRDLADVRKEAIAVIHDKASESGVPAPIATANAIAGAIQNLEREIMLHTTFRPVSIRVELPANAYYPVASLASCVLPFSVEPALGFRLDLTYDNRGRMMCPVLISPGNEGHPDFKLDDEGR